MRRSNGLYLVGAALILTIPLWANTPQEKKAEAPAATVPQDAFGDPLPPGAVARIGTLRYRVAENYLFQPQLSPDGKLLAAPSDTGRLEIWELPAWIKRKQATLLKGSPQTAAFTPDSKQLVVFDQRGQYHLIDLAAGKPILTSPATAKKGGPQNSQSSRLVMSRDKQTVVRHYSTFGKEPSHRVVVWDLAKNEVRDSLTLPTDRSSPRMALAISGDGQRIAQATRTRDPEKKSKGELGIEIWNLTTEKLATKLKTDSLMSHLAFAPDGKTLAASDLAGNIRIYDLATGQFSKLTAAFEPRVSAVEFAPDGKALFVADQTGLTRFDPATGKKSGSFKAPIPVGPRQFGFQPDGKVLALASSGRALHFWEATTGQLFSPKGVPTAAIADLRFAPDQSLFVACMNGSASWWDPRAGAKLRDLRLNGKDVLPFDSGSNGFRAFSLSPSTAFVVGSNLNYGEFDLFDAKTGEKLFGERSKTGEFVFGFFDADRKLAIGSGKDVQVRDPRTGKELFRLELPLRPQEQLMRLEVSPSGKHIAAVSLEQGSDFDRNFLWDVDKKKTTREWPIQFESVAMRFSADEHWLGFGDVSGNLLLVDIGRGGRDHVLAMPGRRDEEGVSELAFAADGRQVACSVGLPYSGRDTSRIYVFEMASKKVRLELPGHATGSVLRLAFSPDGTLLASGASDTTVLTWKAGLRAFTGQPAARDALPGELDDWFAKLAGPDAKAAFQAMIKLAQAPAQSVKFFADKIEPARPPDPGSRTVPQMIQDLGSNTFAVRNKANQALQKLGAAIERDLREAMHGANLETRRRIEVLLDIIVNREWTADEVRHARAVEVLQAITTAEARALLTRWSGGDPSAILTVEARKALAMR